jgi:hypothetical protein
MTVVGKDLGVFAIGAVSLKHIVTDLLKALRNSGHAVPQQDDATVLWKNFLRVGACMVS